MKKKEIHLTETILTIHNEIQSAIDYVDTLSSKEDTELGKSNVIMGVEKLRIKVPLIFEIEQKTRKIEPVPLDKIKPAPSRTLSRDTIIKTLSERRGFLIKDIGEPEGMGLYTKIKVLAPQEKRLEVVSGSEEEVKDEITENVGEIEITFVPTGRKD